MDRKLFFFISSPLTSLVNDVAFFPIMVQIFNPKLKTYISSVFGNTVTVTFLNNNKYLIFLQSHVDKRDLASKHIYGPTEKTRTKETFSLGQFCALY